MIRWISRATVWGVAVLAPLMTEPTRALAHESAEAHAEAPLATDRPQVEMEIYGNYRFIRSNGLPDHATGHFPNRGNPNTIRAQHYSYKMPLNPQQAPQPIPFFLGQFGIALNGIPFDPGAAEFYHGNREWQYEALSGKINLGLDRNNAHVQPSGAYHYHGLPTGLIQKLGGDQKSMTLLGYAADGFPVYAPYAYREPDNAESPLVELRSGYKLKSGNRPSSRTEPGGRYDGTFVRDYEWAAGTGDLDECNGRTGVTPEYPQGTYYYVITETFPFIPRMYRGAPDPSFIRRGPPPGLFPPPQPPIGRMPR